MLKNLKTWMRKKLRGWLDIDRDYIGLSQRMADADKRLANAIDGAADVHFKGNTQIIMISRLNGGRISIFDINAQDIQELNHRAAAVLGDAWPNAVIDAPADFKRLIKQQSRACF